jgi:hypothetical protein
MLKLEKNKKLLKQSRKKSNVKKEGTILIIGIVLKRPKKKSSAYLLNLCLHFPHFEREGMPS